jgi:2,3-bisphosphoglycerate-independent phosphoglycerate mutase
MVPLGDSLSVNIANGNMVGHTGDIEATIVGCKAADFTVKVLHFEIH